MDDFASHTGIRWQGNTGVVEYGGGDRNMVAIFYTKPLHNPAKSNEQGRPIYEDSVFVRIHPPGERLNIVDRPATTQDQRRFPAQWMQFKENREQIPEGTPIDLLYQDKPSVAAMLRAHGVHTIEQCAELSAPAIENIGMGAQQYCNDAAKYLKMSAKGVTASQFRAEMEEKDREIASLKHTIQLQAGQLEKLMQSQAASPTLEQVQQLLSGIQGRPLHPAGAPKQMAPQFDASTAQINANSPTTQISRQKRARARM